MQDYHIYEEDETKDGVTLFRGRKRQSMIVADIKRVEKRHRQRVLNEVSILHSLSHSNIQRFINWYGADFRGNIDFYRLVLYLTIRFIQILPCCCRCC